MNLLKSSVLLAALGLVFISCEDDDTTPAPVVLDAGTLSGGPFTFAVDGVPDMVSGITLNGFDGNGDSQTYVITDDSQNILGMPPTLDALFGVDFDGAGTGSCYIYHLTYNEGLTGLMAGENLDNLDGEFALSNFLVTVRNGLNAGTLSGGPFTFTVDGTPDMVSGISLDETNVVGLNSGYVITDGQNNILGLPPTIQAVEGVDFDAAGVGLCLIWHITYGDGLNGLAAGNNVSNLEGAYALSNSITVNRNPNAGSISGGPFTFSVDGTPDMVSGISLDNSMNSGANGTWVITDDANNILGLPSTLADVEGVDFDGAGIGVCLIWYMRYEDGLEGLSAGNNVSDLVGIYDLSNSITVTRNPNAGTIAGGPFTFAVDGTPEMVSGITLVNSANTGTNGTWVITDDANNILGLPPTLADVEGVDFDAAGTGVCLIWYMRYEDGVTGLMTGNNVAQLEGLYGLSNSITVNRQ